MGSIVAVLLRRQALDCGARPGGRFAYNLLVSVLLLAGQASGQESASEKFNIAAPTMGGTQFWTDRFIHDGWRIQRNVYTGHHRLLDEKDYRRAWGTMDGCRNAFERFRRAGDLTPIRGKVLITLHGLGRSRDSMAGIGAYLADEGPFTWINVSYASTRDSIDAHAAALAEIVANFEEADELHFVAHSLGNLVIRRYLADRVAGAGPPLGRIVMLGPPNQGSQVAERLKGNPLFQTIFGASGGQLAAHWEQVEQRLAIPCCPFGIIAGGRGEDGGSNPLIPGDDDFIVAVEETRLAGAADFLVVPALHTFLMDSPTVRQSTLRFLQHGYFVSEHARQPIPPVEEDR